MVERSTGWITFPPQKHNTKSPAESRTWTIDLETNSILVIHKLFTLDFGTFFPARHLYVLNAAWKRKEMFVCVCVCTLTAHWFQLSYLNYLLNTLDDISNLLAFEPCCSSGCLCLFQIKDKFLSEEWTNINEIWLTSNIHYIMIKSPVLSLVAYIVFCTTDSQEANM